VTVIFLIMPYIIFNNVFVALGIVIANVLIIVSAFTFYVSVARKQSFKKHFLEMAGISVVIAAINFFIGIAIRRLFGIDI